MAAVEKEVITFDPIFFLFPLVIVSLDLGLWSISWFLLEADAYWVLGCFLETQEMMKFDK